MMQRRLFASLLVIALSCTAFAAFSQESDEPQVLPLWSGKAPGAVGEEEADKPTLTLFRPPASKRLPTAVVVIPGGGYGAVMMDHEGKQIAEWLTAQGITAVVLKYRIAPRYHHPAPLLDAQRAIRYVRSHAGEWGIAPDRIGVWGFSAGGHLASTVGTHFNAGRPFATDAADALSSRPDFVILSYPVVSLIEPYAHAGSRKNLLGEKPDPQLIESLSNERQVTPQTPPTFLFHTGDDPVVPVENSVAFYQALRKAGVPAELHVYEHGAHGVGLAKNDPVLSSWTARLLDWLKLRGLLSARPGS